MHTCQQVKMLPTNLVMFPKITIKVHKVQALSLHLKIKATHWQCVKWILAFAYLAIDVHTPSMGKKDN